MLNFGAVTCASSHSTLYNHDAGAESPLEDIRVLARSSYPTFFAQLIEFTARAKRPFHRFAKAEWRNSSRPLSYQAPSRSAREGGG